MTVRDPQLSVGELARLTGATVRTVRHYEDVGLLPPAERSSGGHRRYRAEHVRRLRHVLALRELGVPIERIRPIADGEDRQALLRVLTTHRTEIDRQRAVLATTVDRIDRLTRPDGASGEWSPDVVLDLLEGLTMSVQLTTIYTRTGDDGTTELGSADRIAKTDARIELIGAVDELSAALGLVLAQAPDGPVVEVLWRIQNELFDRGADLAGSLTQPSERVGAAQIAALERDCDRFNAELTPLRSFLLPGSSAGSAGLHLARAVCRRAERQAWQVDDAPAPARQYLNRLSDLLFILARASETGTERLWRPAPDSAER
jgi:cob(I)alamin adenosyltransferase